MIERRVFGTAAVLALGLLTGGCGGSSGEDTEAPDQAAAYVREVEGWCAKVTSEAQVARARLAEIITAAQSGKISRRAALRDLAEAVGGAEGVITRGQASLREISPPPSEEKFHADLLASLEESEEVLGRVRAAARAGDRDTVNALFAEVNASEARRTLLIQKHGRLDSCVEPAGR